MYLEIGHHEKVYAMTFHTCHIHSMRNWKCNIENIPCVIGMCYIDQVHACPLVPCACTVQDARPLPGIPADGVSPAFDGWSSRDVSVTMGTKPWRCSGV